MKKTIYAIACILSILFAQSCGQYQKNENAAITSTEADATDAASTGQKSINEKRIVVKKGDIQIETKDCNPYVMELSALIKNMGGHTTNYTLDANKYLYTTQNVSADSVNNIYKVTETANLEMRVPIAQADTFVKKLMRMQGSIIHLSLIEDDVTADYNVASGIENELNNRSPKQQSNYGIVEKVENSILKNELAYKSKYFWCAVGIKGEEKTVIITSLKPQAYNTAVHLRILESLKYGGQLIVHLMVAILNLWPFILLGLIMFNYRKRIAHFFNISTKINY
jgi:hypothetical protein